MSVLESLRLYQSLPEHVRQYFDQHISEISYCKEHPETFLPQEILREWNSHKENLANICDNAHLLDRAFRYLEIMIGV